MNEAAPSLTEHDSRSEFHPTLPQPPLPALDNNNYILELEVNSL